MKPISFLHLLHARRFQNINNNQENPLL